MTVRVDGGVVLLEGSCPVEEAEALLEALLTHPDAPLDWSECRHMHTALLQVIMAMRPVIHGVPDDPFLRRWIQPLVGPGEASG